MMTAGLLQGVGGLQKNIFKKKRILLIYRWHRQEASCGKTVLYFSQQE